MNATPATTVIGSGPVALAYALFAARNGPVVLRCRRPTAVAVPAVPAVAVPAVPAVPAVESVPAPLLTLLLELGITPAELDVDRLSTHRLVAWEDPTPAERQSPSCAHLDRAALTAALWRRIDVEHSRRIRRECSTHGTPEGGRLVDATGRRAVTARAHARPSPTWVATCCTVARDHLDPTMRLAAGPAGYAYRLGSARWLTVGWVGPGPGPRDAAELRRRLEDSGAGWLADGVDLHDGIWSRRVASLDIPAARDVIAIGDAALARDALASQGMSIGLSDARLAARGATRHELERRRADGLGRHLRSLGQVLASCRYRDQPVWAAYSRWVGRQLEVAARPASGA